MMNYNILNPNQYSQIDQNNSIKIFQLKIQNLNYLKQKLFKQNLNLNHKIISLQHQIQILINSHIDQNTIISNLKHQLQTKKQQNINISKNNQQLLTTILLNQQTHIESIKQYNFYINLYEQKIIQLRQALSVKEMQTQVLEQKYQKLTPIPVALSTKIIDKFNNQFLLYQRLIKQLSQKRNKNYFENVEQINFILPKFIYQPQIKKSKKINLSKQSYSTDIRSNLSNLDQSFSNINHCKIDIVFLKLYLQLRQLKRKYKQKIDYITQLKCRDRIMKQGYNRLIKEIQQIKMQNCRLKIQMDHLNKKIMVKKRISSQTKQNNDECKQKNNSNDFGMIQQINRLKLQQDNNKFSQQIINEQQIQYEIIKRGNFKQQILYFFDNKCVNNKCENKYRQDNDEYNNNGQQQQQIQVQNKMNISISLNTSYIIPIQVTHYKIKQTILNQLFN